MMKPCLYILWAAMLALASCPGDPLQEPEPVHPGQPGTSGTPEGTFIVDYTVDNGSATRAAGKLQVSSLDYYVYYKVGGELAKHRRIPIPDNQVWPLTRDNMTWEQRQALQDTLTCGIDYRILFIANIDSALFNYGVYTAENPHPAVVKGDTLYQNARILLPNVPFHDDNMYCLWEGALNCTESKGVVNRNDILLQRIVTRTDVSRMTFEDETQHLKKTIADTYYEAACRGTIEDNITQCLEVFGSNLQTCANFRIAKEIHKYRDSGVPQFIIGLKDNKEILYKYFKEIIVDELTQTIKDSDIYINRMRSWKDADIVQIDYEDDSRMNSLGFNHTTAEFDETINHYASGLINLEDNGDKKEEFTIIGFAGSSQDMTANILSAIRFYNAGSDVSVFTIEGAVCSINQGINEWGKVICTPIAEIKSINETKADAKQYTLNISTLMKTVFDDCEKLYPGLTEAINDQFWGDVLYADDFKDYSFDKFPFNITLPALTTEKASEFIDLIPSWDITAE